MGMKDFAGKIAQLVLFVFNSAVWMKYDEERCLSSIGIVKSEKTMKKFAESAVKYLRKHKFDGLDLGK